MTKSEILKLYRNRFDKTISVSVKEKLEMQWWIIIVLCNHIVVTNPDIMIYTDPSLIGWGIIDHNTPSRGLWHTSELDNINVLKLKAIEIGVQTNIL